MAEEHDLSSYRDTRILVAEDSPVNQQLILAFLGAIGLNNIQVVENGRQAVDYMRSHDLDIILMDCKMPVMGGLEATETIRKMLNGRVVQIIALTANVMEEEKQHCFDAGMNDYLSKPITKQSLFQTMLTAIMAKSAVM
ncbi:response regulator [Photobacterium nomapromontoriensis]|uniref:response regulator n=1 Tax=Photobacterium nomapromontoriensis TaxID=2910237 RepID=UPI003D14AAB9